MIRHILKSGKVVKDLTGHKITRKDAPRLYAILEKRGETNGNNLRGNQKGK